MPNPVQWRPARDATLLVLWRGYERLGDYVAGFTLAQLLSAAPPPA